MELDVAHLSSQMNFSNEANIKIASVEIDGIRPMPGYNFDMEHIEQAIQAKEDRQRRFQVFLKSRNMQNCRACKGLPLQSIIQEGLANSVRNSYSIKEEFYHVKSINDIIFHQQSMTNQSDSAESAESRERMSLRRQASS